MVEIRSGIGRPASSATSVNASTWGKCDTAANTASWRGGSSVLTRAPQVRHNAATRSIAAGRVSGSGVNTTLRFSYSDANAARSAGVLGPAIGWPGTKRGNAAPKAWRAAAITSCLVLPASVTIVAGPMPRATAEKIAGNCATGAATSTTSALAASCVQSLSSVHARSTTARFRAHVQIGLRAANADDFADHTRALQREANEPPIRPTPTTTSFAICT